MNKKGEVKAQYIFYIIGIIFLFTTVAYFTYEYLFNLSDIIKTIILVCLAVVFFFVADIMAEREV
jgi:positive regulator of sigma E activity